MFGGEQHHLAVRVGLGALVVSLEARDHRVAFFIRVVDKQQAVLAEVRVKGQAKQALFAAAAADPFADIQEGLFEQTIGVENLDLALFLHHEETAAAIAGMGGENRRIQSIGDLYKPERERRWIEGWCRGSGRRGLCGRRGRRGRLRRRRRRPGERSCGRGRRLRRRWHIRWQGFCRLVVAAGGAEGDDAAVIASGTAEGVGVGASGAQAAKTTIRIDSVRLKRFLCFMFMTSSGLQSH